MPDTKSTSARLTVDDLLDLQQVSDAQLHPHGNLIAYTVTANVSELSQQHAPSRIWLTQASGGEPRPVSAATTRASMPRWSPDGTMLAFLGSPNNGSKQQIILLDQQWSEGRQVTTCPGGVTACAWSQDGKSLLYLATVAAKAGDEQAKRAGRDWTVYESDPRFSSLWCHDLASDTQHRLTGAELQVWEFAESPDGRSLVALVSDLPHNWSWYRARLVTIDLTDEAAEPTTIYQPDHQLTGPVWSPDSRSVAVIASTWSDQGMTGGDVMIISSDGEHTANITEGQQRSYLSVDWTLDPQRLLCTVIENGESAVNWLGLGGWYSSVWRDRVGISRWSGSILSTAKTDDGIRLAAVISSPTRPAEVVTALLIKHSMTWTRVTDTNPAIRNRRLAQPDPVTWRSGDGMRIQGLLFRLVGAERGRPLPAIVLIHGGPTSLWAYDFKGTRSMGWVQLLVAQGFAVFLPNPRGSVGFGRAFAEANIGDMGGADFADIMTGIDHLVDAGIVDPDRLGVGGWSYGGYLTAWAITQTDRFKAAVAGASITNWISFHGTSTINMFDSVFYRADPFSWDGCYGQFSPMAHVRNAHTPTLFLHGEKDPICPVGQAHEMWRALREIGVDTELVVYPREGHGPREREHLRDVLERAVNWLSERV